jgi:phosphohistidine phosphatase
VRRLILMRHAKSSWSDPSLRDLDRPLNKRGRKAAALLGAWLKRRGNLPDHALISTARRAQETWAGLAAAAPASAVPEIYHAAPETLLAVLRAAPDVPRLLLVGHQPGIGALAARLLADPPAGPDFARFPTGATAVIDFAAHRWSDVAWEAGRLADFTAPRNLR